MTLGICGAGSTIARKAMAILNGGGGASFEIMTGQPGNIPLDCSHYLICTGFLAGHTLEGISDEDAWRTFDLNFLSLARLCDRIIAANDQARICIIGSHSGYAGSHDMAYAGAKAAMHLYIETKKLRGPAQMLFGIAPQIIADSAMTRRRADRDACMVRGENTRLGRWLNADEVARLAVELLYDASTAISGTIVRMRAD